MPDPTQQLPTKPAAEVAPIEDAGAQALAEALRSGFKIVRWLLLVLVVVFFATGMFIVEPNEVAVILRFGKPVGTGAEQLLKPGWHWAFPKPIDEPVKIPIGQSHTAISTTGWFATTPELEATGKEPPARESLQPGLDGYTLTGDGNIIHVRATLKYRISTTDALNYEFGFARFTNAVQHALDHALVYASARFTADQALYRDTARFKETVLDRMNHQIETHGLGITIEPSEIKVSAPLAVRPAFDAVLAAEQDRSKKISEARGGAEQTTRKAIGEANAIVNAGSTAENQLVQSITAEARYFTDQLPSYRKDPALFEQRHLTETMTRVLTNAQDKFFIPTRADGRPRELRLQLNREPQKPSAPNPTSP